MVESQIKSKHARKIKSAIDQTKIVGETRRKGEKSRALIMLIGI